MQTAEKASHLWKHVLVHIPKLYIYANVDLNVSVKERGLGFPILPFC